MLFALICKDKPGHLDTRKANRDAHLAYAKDSGAVKFGGPLIEDGNMVGSLCILDVEDRAAAEAWAANDPYAQAGLFDSTELSEWKHVL